MISYKIVIARDGDSYSEVCNVLTFPEAASIAYSLRATKGFDWKIISISEV